MEPVPLSKIGTRLPTSPGSTGNIGTLLLALKMLVPIPQRSTVQCRRSRNKKLEARGRVCTVEDVKVVSFLIRY